MALQHYQGARELVMKPETLAAVETGVAALRLTIQSYGFSKEAADSLNFKVTEHSLFISDEERRSGAFHMQADGQPFFAVTLTAPGSMMDITPAASATPTAVPANQQTALLSFEIGMNLFSRVEDAMAVKFGTTPDNRAGGVSSEIMRINFETTTRRDPAQYFSALNDLVDMRLGMLTPKLEAVRKPAPKTSGGRRP